MSSAHFTYFQYVLIANHKVSLDLGALPETSKANETLRPLMSSAHFIYFSICSYRKSQGVARFGGIARNVKSKRNLADADVFCAFYLFFNMFSSRITRATLVSAGAGRPYIYIYISTYMYMYILTDMYMYVYIYIYPKRYITYIY